MWPSDLRSSERSIRGSNSSSRMRGLRLRPALQSLGLRHSLRRSPTTAEIRAWIRAMHVVKQVNPIQRVERMLKEQKALDSHWEIHASPTLFAAMGTAPTSKR